MSLREKLLDALDNADGELCNHYGEQCPEQTTDAALDTFRQRLEENGLEVCPIIPTLEMKMAGAEAITEDHMRKMANYDAAIDCYAAMIAAAPDALGGEK